MVGSNQKRYAELRTDSTQVLDSELSVSVRLSEVSEEGLEAGWREHFRGCDQCAAPRAGEGIRVGRKEGGR